MKKTLEKNIPTYVCDSASEVVDLLSVTSNIWEGHAHSSWLARGHGRSTWKLEPSILRNFDLKPGIESRREIFQREYQYMQLFKVVADEAGLSIPGDSQLFRTWEGTEDAVTTRLATLTWPPIEALDTLAFIQHHGIPTRLLDFTHNPFVALFFAAKHGVEEMEKSKNNNFNICLWLIHNVGLAHIYTFVKEDKPYPRYAEITAPYADNEFLKRQQGLFLLDRCFATEMPIYQTLDEILSIETGKGKLASQGFCLEPVKRIELSMSEANAVFLLLKKMHISFATLMPSFDNIKKHIELYNRLESSQYSTMKW